MNRLMLILLLAGVVALVIVTTSALGSRHGEPAHGPNVAAPQEAGAGTVTGKATAAGDELPPEVHQKYPPRTFIPLRLPKVKSGISCPDGSFLPLLNGVTEPCKIRRLDWTGPVTPVIGKWTDDENFEWWFHADGSVTTTRYLDVTHSDGRKVKTATTTHGAPLSDSAGQPGPKTGSDGGSGITPPAK